MSTTTTTKTSRNAKPYNVYNYNNVVQGAAWMAYFQFQWTDEIAAHLSEHDVSRDDFESVVNNPERRGESRSTQRPCCWGETPDGRYLLCVYEYLDVLTIIPITAYEISRHGK